MQNVADAQDTPVSAAFGGPLGPGTVCGVQFAADAVEAALRATAPITATQAVIAAPRAAARRSHIPIPIPIRMSSRPLSGGASLRETAAAT
jgi:hypothetical protein